MATYTGDSEVPASSPQPQLEGQADPAHADSRKLYRPPELQRRGLLRVQTGDFSFIANDRDMG